MSGGAWLVTSCVATSRVSPADPGGVSTRRWGDVDLLKRGTEHAGREPRGLWVRLDPKFGDLCRTLMSSGPACDVVAGDYPRRCEQWLVRKQAAVGLARPRLKPFGHRRRGRPAAASRAGPREPSHSSRSSPQ